MYAAWRSSGSTQSTALSTTQLTRNGSTWTVVGVAWDDANNKFDVYIDGSWEDEDTGALNAFATDPDFVWMGQVFEWGNTHDIDIDKWIIFDSYKAANPW